MTAQTSQFLHRNVALACLGIALTLNPWMAEAKQRYVSSQPKHEKADAVELATATDTALVPPAIPDTANNSRKFRNLTIPFDKLGARSPLGLRGTQGMLSLPFSVRSDEVVVGAHLSLDYNYSPSLLPELSDIQVLMNEEVVMVIPLPKDKNLQNHREIDIDPRLFSDFNKLSFRLNGHYTYQCEDILHSSLWANISHKGKLQLKLAPLNLVNDLRTLPVPFFDRRDDNVLNLPFVFPRDSSLGTIRASGIVSSWFGSLAGYRGAQFPASTETLPAGNAVVFVLPGSSPSGLVTSEITGPTLAIEPHPQNPNAKLLVIGGRNENELLIAARTLVFNEAALSGQRVVITKETEPAPRKPYDAPAWISTDKPVRFAELAKPEDLQVRGFFPDLIKLNFRLSPDVFIWRSAGVPVDLKFRSTQLPFAINSSLNVGINENFVRAIPLILNSNLNLSSDKSQPNEKIKKPVLKDEIEERKEKLLIPPYRFTQRNQLQMMYHFEFVKEGECRDSLPANLEGAIAQDSTIDFSDFPHYAALPNLAYFANLGYPFTRYADLAETAIILSEAPSISEISTYLSVLGKMGESTGYPAIRHALITSNETDKMTNRDLIVIGSTQHQPLFARWNDRLPLVTINGERRLRTPDALSRLLYRWEEKDLQTIPRPEGLVHLTGANNIVAFMGLESPITSKRSVVMIYADADSDLQQAVDALNDPEKIAKIQGDITIINNNSPEHFRAGETYYVGELPLLSSIRWHLSQHPLLTGLLALIGSLIIASLLYRWLRKLAAKRLALQKS